MRPTQQHSGSRPPQSPRKTGPADAASTAADRPPFGLHVASVLCWVVGIISVLTALAVSVPLLRRAPTTWIPLVVNLSASILVCIAAVLVRRRRRLGAYLVLVAWALPNLVNLLAGVGLRLPSLFITLALITLIANWHELR